MILRMRHCEQSSTTAPRTRGDDPSGTIPADVIITCSPHARG